MGKFLDWDDKDTVIGWQPQTAVCVTEHGEIEVLQPPGAGGTGESVICLNPMAALILAWRLIEVAHEVGLPKPPRELMTGLDTGPVAPLAANGTMSGEAGPSPLSADAKEAA